MTRRRPSKPNLMSSLITLLGALHVVQGTPMVPKTRILPSALTNWKDCKECSVTITPGEVAQSGDWVEIDIQGIVYATPTDWVGIFSPDDITPDGAITHYPIRWQFANTTCYPRPTVSPPPPQDGAAPVCVGEACCEYNNFTRSGTAKIGMVLVDVRAPLVVALVEGDAQYPFVVAVSNVVKFKTPKAPLQAHLARTQDPSSMRVSWTGGADLTSPASVKWGTSVDNLTSVALATHTTYAATDMCGAPGNSLGFRDPGTLYSGVMTGLQAGQEYFYSVGSDDPLSGWRGGKEFRFTAPPDSGSTVHIATFGDMGKAMSSWDGSLEHSWDNPPGLGEIGSWNTTEMLKRDLHDGLSLVMHIGDISYAVGYASEWDDFMAQIEPVSRRVPWMTGIGNHEANCPCDTNPPDLPGVYWFNGTDSGGECGIPYMARFPMPAPPSSSSVPAASLAPLPLSSPASVSPLSVAGRSPWYSVTHGPVVMVIMSTEDDFSKGSRQLRDIENMLAAVDRTKTPWLVFGGHRPMYCSSIYGVPAAIPLQSTVEPLLAKYDVDLALWGHHHSYQRSCRMFRGKCIQGAASGTVHVIIGAAGYEFSGIANASSAPDWLLFGEDSYYGYGRIQASPTQFDFSFVRTDTGEVVDGFGISR